MNGRHRRPLLAVGAVLTLLLSACAPDSVAGWEPRQWSVSGSIVRSPAPTDPGHASTLDMRLQNDDVDIDARWASLPGAPAFNTAVEAVVRAAVQEQVVVSGRPYRPTAHPVGAGLGERGCAPGSTTAPAAEVLGERTGTVVVCEIVLARGAMFGERIRVLTARSGGAVDDTSTTIYTDAATGTVATDTQLFTDPAALWPAYIDTLRRDAGSVSPLPVGPPTDAQLAVFEDALAHAELAAGEIVIPVPAELTARELDGLAAWRERSLEHPPRVALREPQTSGALSPVGEELLAAEGVFTGQPSAGAGFEHVPCDLVPCMALTLDDGPSSLTPQFLDVLRDEHSAATFYMLGQNAQSHPDTVRRVAAEGHEIGNHTWDHSYLTGLTDAQIGSELGQTAVLLRELSGQAVSTFRPPGGYVNDHVVGIAGQPAVLWSVDTRDWEHPSDDDLARYAIETPDVSTIMLMHDIQAGSARVFAEVVAGLRDRGFSLVTVEALFGGTVPGGIVRHGPLV
ncbi:polysaccharide deacetylase family protein [Microbacterium sp. EST19A]|uniref:polysaccharide deacetylase family protein n=1 Tax=Microbacterium sp. EST19A TaxID=2862681 RepID=UPI001CBDB29B|nr:polysaccharide deacetylase family protein [Microbacterium sp. EST19A]